MAAEVHASLKQWAEAVDCLQRLSRASIPDDQRRVAHLGAAGFLEKQLGAKAEALDELRAVEALGLTDAETWTRIAALEIELGRPEAAADAYRRALDAEPANQTAISGLVELVDQTEVETAVARYEAAVWSLIDAGELDASLLEAVRSAAAWRGHRARATAARAVQRALGLAEPDEEDSVDLSGVSMAAIWDPNTDPVLEELVLRGGIGLDSDRLRAKKVASSEPIYAELEQVSERFGARIGSVEISSELRAPVARTSRSGEIRWVVPEHARGGLDSRGRFLAGRLAIRVPLPDPYRMADVLQRRLTAIPEHAFDATAYALVDYRGDAYAARFRERLQACRHVDPVAVHVVTVGDYVADVDADPQRHAAGVARSVLNGDRAVDRIHDTAELDQRSVTDKLEDPALVQRHGGVEHLLTVSLQGSQRARLVRLHHA